MKRPEIRFPCDYPISIVAKHEPGIDREITDVVRRFAPGTRPENVRLQFSRTRKYVSIRVTIEATGEDQLKQLFEALKQDRRVNMVL